MDVHNKMKNPKAIIKVPTLGSWEVVEMIVPKLPKMIEEEIQKAICSSRKCVDSRDVVILLSLYLREQH